MTNANTYRVVNLVWDIRSTTFEIKDVEGNVLSRKIHGRTVDLKLDTASKLLLLMLAAYADHRKGFTCFVLHSTLASGCLMDRKTVGRKLALLKALGLVSWVPRGPKSSLFSIKVAKIREFSEPQRAARKAARAAEAAAENALIAENRFDSPADDASILDAPAPVQTDTTVRPALMASLTSLTVKGERISGAEAASIAKTLMKRFPNHDALVSAIANVKPEEMARVDAAQKPSGLLITILESLARECASLKPDEPDSDPDDFLDFPDEL
jgi:hypothetical protein